MIKYNFGLENYQTTKGGNIWVQSQTFSWNLDINRSDRICQQYEDNLIGDEYLYVCEIKSQETSTLRKKYLPGYYYKKNLNMF